MFVRLFGILFIFYFEDHLFACLERHLLVCFEGHLFVFLEHMLTRLVTLKIVLWITKDLSLNFYRTKFPLLFTIVIVFNKLLLLFRIR